MNPKFPNFNFDIWFRHYVNLYYNCREEHIDWQNNHAGDLIEDYKFYFDNQIHDQFDIGQVDLANEYLSVLCNFNSFMRFIYQQNEITKNEIVEFLLSQRGYAMDFSLKPKIEKNCDQFIKIIALQTHDS